LGHCKWVKALYTTNIPGFPNGKNPTEDYPGAIESPQTGQNGWTGCRSD